MPFRSQCLRQSIRNHILRFTVLQLSPSILNTVSDEVILDVDVLCTSVVFWIVSKCDGALTVAVDGVLIANIISDFVDEVKDPDLFLECMK